MPLARSALRVASVIPRAKASALNRAGLKAPNSVWGWSLGAIAHGALPASRLLIASALAWVSFPALTWSASVWPIAFWNAALKAAWEVFKLAEKCVRKSLHRAEG